MKLIAVSGLKGGVGAATVAANLTGSLHSLNKRVAIIDLDTRNSIRTFFSMAMSDRDGWATRVINSQDWSLACHKSPEGVLFVPIGELGLSAPDFTGSKGTSFLFDTSLAFGGADSIFPEMLSVLAEHVDYVIVHLTPLAYVAGIYTHLDALHAKADLHLVVANPDTACNAMLHTMATDLRRFSKLNLLLNKFNLSSEAGSDFVFHMKQEYGDFLISNPLYYDEALVEASANLQTVDCYAPNSQGCSDFQSLALWCIANLSRGDNG